MIQNENKIPTVSDLTALFNQVNIDCKENGERKVALSNYAYYTEQIYNLYFEDLVIEGMDEEAAWQQAEKLAKSMAKEYKNKKKLS